MRKNRKLRLIVGIVCSTIILVLVSYVAYGASVTDQPETKGLRQGHQKLCKDAWPDDPLKEEQCLSEQLQAESAIYFGVMMTIQDMPENNPTESTIKLLMKAIVVRCLQKNSAGDITDSVSSLQCINNTMKELNEDLHHEQLMRGGVI